MVAGAINQHLIAPAVLLNFGAEVTPPNCAIRIDEPEIGRPPARPASPLNTH